MARNKFCAKLGYIRVRVRVDGGGVGVVGSSVVGESFKL